MANRLAQSTSPYLKGAAHQPIDWYEFCPEAFEAAREQDKPVLLDIGAAWCHWCHVIDRESYDDPEIARYINAHFIAIKVDRDQRPDIDARYQHVVASMAGQGGWPLTAFLTHDGRVFYGGTYFPPDTMKKVLQRIHAIYYEAHEDIYKAAEIITTEKAQSAQEQSQAVPVEYGDITEESLVTMMEGLTRGYDEHYGGWGSGPKFPHWAGLQFILTRIHHDAKSPWRFRLEKTLMAMALGGMYDQIAGGFHRYSVDQLWHVPHFEKMAYDNGEALSLYAQAARLTGNPLFSEIVQSALHWLMSEFCHPSHGYFYTAQDADIDLHDDGDYFTWTLAEVADVTSPQELAVLEKYYGLTPEGDMKERPGRNVLRAITSLGTVAQELDMSEEETVKPFSSGRLALAQHRKSARKKPAIDTTPYTNWNGMLITGAFKAGSLLNLVGVVPMAAKALEWVLDHHWDANTGKLLHTQGVPGVLEDYVWLARAALEGWMMTGQPRYYTAVGSLVEVLLTRFWDDAHGGFFDVEVPDDWETAPGLLKFRRKPMEDSPSTSPNAVGLQVLLDWATIQEYHGNPDQAHHLEQLVKQTLEVLEGQPGQFGLFHGGLAQVVHRYLHGPIILQAHGFSPADLPEPGSVEHEFTYQLIRCFHPNRVIVWPKAENTSQDDPPSQEGVQPPSRPSVTVCIHQTCLPLAETPDSLSGLMKHNLPGALPPPLHVVSP